MTDGDKQAAPVEISVVIPAYDEEEAIARCLSEVKRVMDSLGRPYEIVVVDDGSRDATFEILREHRKTMPELVALRFDRNNGQTAAFDAGFKAARGEIIVTMDADLQNDPADIPRLVELVGQWPLVNGYRQKRRDSLVRKVSSKIGNGVRNRLTGRTVRDVGCSIRAFRAECVRGLPLFEGMHRFLPTLIKMRGYEMTEIPVNHRPRALGKSKYGVLNRAFKGLRDLFAVRWMQRRWLRYRVEEKLG